MAISLSNTSHLAIDTLRGLSGFDAISAGNNGVASSAASSVSLTGVSGAIVITGGNRFQDGSNPWSAGGVLCLQWALQRWLDLLHMRPGQA